VTPRVRRTFWILVIVAVVATGALSRALAARPGPAAGLAVAGTSVTLALTALLALRILFVVGRRAAASSASVSDRSRRS